MRMFRTAVAGIAIAGALAATLPAAAQAAGAAQAPPPGEQVPAAAWQGKCAKGDFCVWHGKNGTGTKCAWDGDDPDWRNGNVQCQPKFLVGSYWNNGYKGDYDKVNVYISPDYKGYWGQIPVRSSGTNLWEGAPMESHRWVN